MNNALNNSLLRTRDSEEGHKVNFVELFFDLVFVFAITRLSHFLIHHFSFHGLAETALLMLAVWWVWIYTSWVTNWLDPQKTPVRMILFILMLAGLFLAISIPGAFKDSAPLFVFSYVFMQLTRSVFMCWALRGKSESNYKNFLRITSWFVFSGVFWVAGLFFEGETRFFIFGMALFIEYLSPTLGFWTPTLGKSSTSDWDISGAHMAERCGLFIIIVLGESLLVTGAKLSEIPFTVVNIISFLIAFLATVTMWWIYFNVGAERASVRISKSDDPGRIARLAYTYLHIPIIAGLILISVSDELILAHPGDSADMLSAVAIFGGPLIFLLGNILFKKAVFGKFAESHLTGIICLALASLLYSILPILALAFIATIILIVVGVWENISVKSRTG